MLNVQLAAGTAFVAALLAFGTVWQPQPGEPLWDLPVAWVLPVIPIDPAVAVHLDHGAGSVADVRAVLSWVDYDRAAAVWDDAHDAHMWWEYDRAMGDALAAFRASDTRIRRAHRVLPCRSCSHPYVDEPTGEYRMIPRRHLGPSALVGAL